MNGIEEREKEADGDSLDPLAEQGVNGRAQRCLVEGNDDLAFAEMRSRTSLRRAPGARQTGVSGSRIELVDLPPDLAADLEDVAETLGGDQDPGVRLCARAPHWWRQSCRAQKRSIFGEAETAMLRRKAASAGTAPPGSGSARVEGTFMMCVCGPARCEITSVKVPPMSIPTLTPDMAPRLRR